MKYFVTVQDRTFEVDVAPGAVVVDGESVTADLARIPGEDVYNLLLDGASHRILANGRGSGAWDLHLGGGLVQTEAVDERTKVIREMTARTAGPSGPKPIKAPMPGLVVKIEVAEGDAVREGQGVVIVEAMKMENELKAQAAGVVAKIHVAAGDTVEKDQVLIDFVIPERDEA